MPTPAGESKGLGAAARAVSERIGSIVRLELQLAANELKRKVVSLGIGIALLLGAALFLVFTLLFAFLTVAAVFATFLSTWLALLVTTGILVALAGALAFVGVTLLAKGTPPVPEQAIEEARLTTEALKNGR
ncbi:MAG: phage holin family protein [Actinomycetota bacterium]